MDEQQPRLDSTKDQYEYQVSPITWTLKTSWNTAKVNWLSLLGLMLLPMIPIIILGIVIAGLVVGAGFEEDDGGDIEGGALAALISVATAGFFAFMAFMLYMYSRIYAGLFGGVKRFLDENKKFKTMAVWNEGGKRAMALMKTTLAMIWPILVLYFLAPIFLIIMFATSDIWDSGGGGLAGFAGAILFVVALYIAVIAYGYYLFTRLGLAPMYAVIEELGVKESLAKSKKVTGANRSMMFGLFFAVFGVSVVISIFSNIPILGLIASIVWAMFTMVFPGVLYQLFILRNPDLNTKKKEGSAPSLSDTV